MDTTPRASPRAAASNAAHILIVDDSLDELRALKSLLDAHAFRLSIAFDGHQGYQRAQLLQPDLILMDVRMPRLNGFATCRLLQECPSTRAIPVIFLTAASTPDERLSGLTIGGVDYINKPFNAEEVLARVRIHLRLAAQNRQHAQAHTDTPTPSENTNTISNDSGEILLQACIRLIRSRLSEELTVTGIASELGSYEKKLSSLFREKTGMTVYAFLREERLKTARIWLGETSTSVREIAEQLGFQNAGNFATAFKSRFGVTPSSYRESVLSTRDACPEI
ncbi:MAG: response regulator transcription factor [Zoogloea sp.]|uniref:response regulator transcription factor n=1 Tax=Zoogloea sp. TaxID=49181 RepID=UPI003F2C123B